MPIELPDGKIATMTTQAICISDDKGETYATGCRNIPGAIAGFWAGVYGFCYNEVAGAFYSFWWDGCGANSAIASDQIWRFDTLITSGATTIHEEQRVQRPAAISAARSVPAAVYDVLGREINALPAAAAQKIYFVRTADGVVTRQHLKDR
jgi:hypothetical protein